MKRLVALLPVLCLLAAPAVADFYVAGDFNGWDAAGNVMTDLGGGFHSLSLTLGADEWHEFKVTDGTWDDAWPQSGNSWLYTDGDGNITITYDTNTYTDGWLGATERIGLNYEPGHQWAVAGDVNGWSNNDPAWYMTDMGGGIRSVTATIAAPGDYYWKPVEAGSWNSIGADARSVNADNMMYTTTVPDEVVTFEVDVLTGITRAVPEPATLVGLLLGLGLIRRR
ncbi:MAG: PEP-CTERM sorting domain-containing protein [Planctomycetes bacterium]|nr:PEP-CTERM sorting domain-containing protein [Planctomycetota bacterium]